MSSSPAKTVTGLDILANKGQWCLSRSAQVGAGPLTRQLTLRTCSQDGGGGGSGARLSLQAAKGKVRGGAAHCSACACQCWQGVGSNALVGESMACQGIGKCKLALGASACWRGRDPTINMRWKVEGRRGEGGDNCHSSW
jgi:hypothetical protein